VGRIVQRACEIMREHRPTTCGATAEWTCTIQKYINFHCSVSARPVVQRGQLLHHGPQGPLREDQKKDDHRLRTAPTRWPRWPGQDRHPRGGRARLAQRAARTTTSRTASAG
jgi:hypothetical protein